MTRILAPFFLCLGLALARASGAPAPQAVEDQLVSAPAWVEPLPVDLKTPPPFDEINAGTFFRLVDVQTDVESGTVYGHYAQEILSNSGLHSMSELEIDFDPSFQRIELHQIDILRGKKRFSIFDSGLMRILQKETEVDYGIWNGERTLVHFLPELRVGDVLEYSYSIVGQHPSMRGKFTDSFLLEWEEDVMEACYRLRKPNDRQVRYRAFGASAEPNKVVKGEAYTNLYWKRRDVPAVLVEDHLPSWYHALAWVQLSEFKSWGEVAEWGDQLFAAADSGITPEAAKVIEDIRGSYLARDDQVMAVMRWVSDEVRYVGIEGGTDSYCPRQPELTLRNRYGDCKDKTLLLHRMLKEIGVDSVPMYVDSQEGRNLPDLLPSPTAFDHVVLRVRPPEGPEFDCDPTMTGQGGDLKNFYMPNYHWGLLLEESTRQLVELAEPDPEKNGKVTIVEDYLLGDPGEGIELKVATDFVGSLADSVRKEMHSSTPAYLERNYLDYYLDNYPYTRASAPLSFKDNRNKNFLRVTENYHIDDLWEPDSSDPDYMSLRLYYAAIRNSLDVLTAPQRSSPFGLRHPKNVVQIVRVHGNVDAMEFTSDPVKVEGPGFRFTRQVEQKPGYLELKVSYQTLRDHVLVEELQDYYDALQEMLPYTNELIWYNLAVGDAATTGESSDSTEYAYKHVDDPGPVPGVWLWAEQPLDPGMVLMLFVVVLLGAGVSIYCANLGESRMDSGEFGASPAAGSVSLRDMVMGLLILLPVLNLAILPLQSWHLFVVPYNLDEDTSFDPVSMFQTLLLAMKLLALVGALAIFWLLVHRRLAGVILGRVFFLGYPILLILALALNLVQHPHREVMLVASSFELLVAIVGGILGTRYLFGTTLPAPQAAAAPVTQ